MAKPKETALEADGELNEAELQEESDRIERARAADAQKKQEEKTAAAGTKNQKELYNREEVMQMIRQALADDKKKDEIVDDEEQFKQKQVRVPRFTNKFIFAFKNTNNDPYFAEVVTYAFDVWNEKTRRNEAWVTVIFEDETEMNVPLATVIEKSKKVWLDLVEVIEKDSSYVDGKVEKAQMSPGDWSPKQSGNLVKVKVTKADYSYKVKLPDGKEVIVAKEVINW